MKKIIGGFLACIMLLPSQAFALSKTESVFTTLNPTGGVEKTIVTNHIAIKDKEELLDDSDLDKIESITGQEFIKDGSKLTWKAKGEDIFYQGTTSKEMPIDINIKYYLNNEEKQVKDIIGKKGNIKIEVSFKNNLKNIVNVNGIDEEVYTPFVVVLGTVIDNKNNRNITVSNGKVVLTGEKNIVASLASPGLYESLNIDKLNNINKIEISYTTKSFSLNNIYIAATPKLIDERDMAVFDKVNEVVYSINKLQDGINEIEEGAINLSNGSNSLSNGAKELSNGTKEMYNGILKINESMPDEDQNINNEEALNNLKNTNESTVQTLNVANTQIKSQKEEVLKKLEEAQGKKAYIETQLNSVNTNLEQATSAYNEYSNKLNQVNLMMQSLESQINEENKETLTNQIGQLKLQKQSLETIVPLLYNQVEAISGTKESLNGTLTSVDLLLQLLNETKQSLDASIAANEKIGLLISGNNKVVSSSIETINSMRKLSSAMNELQGASLKINAGAQALSTGADKLDSGVQTLSSGISRFNKEGINTLSNYSKRIKMYSNKLEALVDLSNKYKGFTTNNSNETIFISKVKSYK